MSVVVGASAPSAPAAPSTTPNQIPNTPSTPSSSNTNTATGTTPVPSSADAGKSSPPSPGAIDPRDPKVAESSVPKPEPRLHRLKIDGVEEELSEDEVIKRAQYASAAQKRFQEAATIRKQGEQLVRNLQTNPLDVLLNPAMGIDKNVLREQFENWYKSEFIEPEMLTPEQKKAKDQERQLQEYRKREQTERERNDREQSDRLSKHYVEDYQKKFITALDTSGLPKTESTMRRMAFYLSESLKAGDNEMPLDLVVEQVRRDYVREIKDVLGASDGTTLLKLLGDDVTNKIRRADLERLRANRPSVPSKPPEAPIAQGSDQEKPKKAYITMDEWKAQIAKKLNS